MVASDVAPLFKPLSVGPITLRNRVTMSALTRARSAPTNIPNALNVEHYQQRAKGGAGLIVTEGVLVSQQGTEWPNAPGIWSAEQVAGWKKVTDVVHAEGSYIYAQLWHVGRVAHPDADDQKASGLPVYAPSAVAARGGKFRFIAGIPGYVTPTEVSDPSILVEQFRKAAVNAKEAGFDGVELHGANGYLIHQFLDSGSNLRTDAWGGSVEKRAKFGLEVLKAVIGVFGKNRVAIKLSPAVGYNDMGMPLAENIATFKYFITEADKLDLAFFTLVRYLETADISYDDGKTTRAAKHDVLATYRPFIKRNLVILNGGLTAPEAAALIAEGKIDAGMFGILWIGHPDLAKRIEKGKPLDAQLDFTRLHGHGPTVSIEEHRKGYNDYPEAVY